MCPSNLSGGPCGPPNPLAGSARPARRVAEDGGLQVVVEREYYSPSVPEGRILSQLPPAGTQVRRGWEIRVAESLGPQRVEIPNVLGQSERAAEINIRRRGLDIGAVASIEMAGATADQVLSQSPPPNASGVAAPKISLLVTEPSQPQGFVMPSFIGQPLGSASLALQDAGLHVGIVTVAPQPAASTTAAPVASPGQAPPPSPASLIVSQNPAPGEKVTAGAVVNVQVR